ncbi:MAG: hypothetical protein ACSHX7_11755 [Luteolibacter sp.]
MNQKQNDFSGVQFARQIVNSWKQKDPEALKDYVAGLPEGAKRTSFEQALKTRKGKN